METEQKKLVRTKLFFELNHCKNKNRRKEKNKNWVAYKQIHVLFKEVVLNPHTACTLNRLISNSSLPSIKKRKNSLTFALPDSNLRLPHQQQKHKVFHLQYYNRVTVLKRNDICKRLGQVKQLVENVSCLCDVLFFSVIMWNNMEPRNSSYLASNTVTVPLSLTGDWSATKICRIVCKLMKWAYSSRFCHITWTCLENKCTDC